MYSRVYVEITNICNKNCSFCIGTKRAPKMMSRPDFITACDKLKGITEYIYFHLMGEPLLHPEITDFVKITKEMGFKPCITTNGTLLKEKGEELINAGVYKVSISLHSFENGNEADYIDYLNSCISFADKASKSGVLTVFRLWNKGCDGGRNADVLEKIKATLEGEWKEGGKGIRIRNRLHLEYGERFSWPDMSASNTEKDIFCYGLKDHFGILADGRVVPCCLDHEGDITLGNIFADDLTEILSSERVIAIRKGFEKRKPPEELCKKCGYATRF